MAQTETRLDLVRMCDLAKRLMRSKKVSDTDRLVYRLVRIRLTNWQLNEGILEITLAEWDALCMEEHAKQVSKAKAA